MLVAKGGARLKPDEGIKITGFNTDAGPATVGLATRFQEIGLANRGGYSRTRSSRSGAQGAASMTPLLEARRWRPALPH